MQKLFGVSLTGDTSDQSFYILHGTGANGKTTLVQAYAALLGDYALSTPTSTFLSRRDSGVPNDLARLRGARFVYAAEPDVSLHLAEALLKLLTGGEPITARFLFAEFFSFYPEFKLLILANHLPDIESGDDATWRRIHLIPFTQTIPVQEREKHFKEKKLLPELAGILNWGLEGLAMWQAEGLDEPEAIRIATAEYRRECDDLEGFFQECVVVDPDAMVSKQDLYAAYGKYQFYARDSPRLSIQLFGRLVKGRGIRDGNTGQARVWKGIRLKDPGGGDLTTLTDLTAPVGSKSNLG
ncbi:MAG: hypothetical protein A3H29_05395 [Acidobacteria bacterium RIFCSPLOWO2_02_FULL_67_21]|nr:MAG: hypothetical protein A3H29_05395 [Acidobacteria bacterium RIFCSPLOWO2_02_FULL_67_21]